MWAGAPAPARPAGSRTCELRLDFVAHSAVVAWAALRRAPLLPASPAPRARAGVLPPAAAATKEAVPAMVSYTVQKGERLWDVAVQHGVSMRTIKDLNKLSGSEPVLKEGQQLLVPASGITAVAAVDGATSAAALGSTPARGLWVRSEQVRLATVAEAKELYLRQCDRGNSQNTLLVLYAPWCPHCREMEDELERLAEGLSHVPAVRVVAVNCDSLEGRMFAREVLGVAYYPSIISFPEHSRTFFKYKGRQRDAESLLRFLNVTCCAREDQMWSLRPAGSHSAVVLPGGKWFGKVLPVGTSPGAMATAVGLLALVAAAAAAVVVARRRRAAAAASAGDAAAEADVVAELDSSLSRMAALMLRAVGTRVALLLGLVGPTPTPVEAATGEANGAAEGVPPGAPAAEAASEETPAEAARRRRAAAAAAAAGGGNGNGNGNGNPAVQSSPADVGRVMSGSVVGTAAVGAATVVDVSLGAGARGLSAEERMRLTRLTDDELIALVNSDPDLDKVLSRLLGDK